ncbi:MAG: hypothetical protein ACI4DK_12175, partial [Lachnospiraceae bacterium]
MGKTIRQLAEELGVTKPTIAKAIRELDIEPQKIGNRNELSDEQCEQIKIQISKKSQISDLQKTPTETQKTPTETQKTPTETQKTPTETQKTPTETQKTPTETQKTPTETQKTPTETQKTPTETQKTP